jgi:CRP-like cAMP-binding protein
VPDRLDFTRGWPFASAQRGAGRISSAELELRQQALARAPLFASLSKRQIRTIAQITGVSEFDQGASIVKEGSHGDAFFVILEGSARVVSGPKEIARLGAGDFFGEISLLDGDPRMASVIAETPMKCLDLAGEDFRSILEGEPGLALDVLRVVARRLRTAEQPPAG